MNRAIFFDVDGTLIDSEKGKKDMTEPVKRAIRALQADGDYVFVATGRPYAFISPILKEFGFDGFLLSNGAQIVMGDKTIYHAPMDPKFVAQLSHEFESHNIEYILEGDYYSYIKSHSQNFYDFYMELGISPDMLKRELDSENAPIYKIEALCPKPEMAELCVSLLDQYPDYVYFFSVSKILFEVHARESTKATGIRKVLELLNIPIENSFAFGDGHNDIEMLKEVGCGIVMDNALDEVKSYADEVTDSVACDGVATGIYKYILNEQELCEEKAQ